MPFRSKTCLKPGTLGCGLHPASLTVTNVAVVMRLFNVARIDPGLRSTFPGRSPTVAFVDSSFLSTIDGVVALALLTR